MKNHLGEKEYQTYAGWRAACKKVNPAVTFEGNKDICNARGVGEWGGDVGSVYNVTKAAPKFKADQLAAIKGEGKREGTLITVRIDGEPEFINNEWVYTVQEQGAFDDWADVPESQLIQFVLVA